MRPEELLNILHLAERLKDTPRHCYTSGGRRESVAEHSWRTALMAYLVADEFPGADMGKVIKMCLIHDMGEAFTGDIPVFSKTAGDEAREEELLFKWVDSLPEPYRTEFASLYREMAERQTTEARIYKAMDSLEAVIQHNESDISTWEPHEYALQREYAWDRMAFSEYLTQLRQAVLDETEEKIKAKPEGIPMDQDKKKRSPE
ncbi:MAG: HD domain-containing protein [Clostridia bacterium]|nr:HD domain-containing protein [Clostridia bacterium]